MSLYPKTQSSPALATNVVKMLDTAMGNEEQGVAENNGQMAGTPAPGGMYATYQARENQPIDEDYIDERSS